MMTVNEEITQERFELLIKMSSKDMQKEIEKDIPIAWYMGRGYYGSTLSARDGKYYIVHNVGSSCD